jgi:3-hydroxyacyl-CoA dehydrogenase/enoyl-CoA hydratase/3-hydroxybutyryl-CoA epimerase
MERDADDIVWLTLDKPGSSTNVLGHAILEELDSLLERLAADPPKGVVIRSGKANGFVAGADIKGIHRLQSATDAYASFARPARVRQD